MSISARLLAVWFISIALVCPANAQLGDIFDKIGLKGKVDLKGQVQNLFNKEPISTNINDANNDIAFLDGFDFRGTELLSDVPLYDDGWHIASGTYSGVVESYCLHAGTYAPRKGNGYIYAPLKGQKASLIRQIVRGHASHPEQSQQGTQSLVWAALARTKYDDISPDLKRVATNLLPSQNGDLEPKYILDFNGGALSLISQNVIDDFIRNANGRLKNIYTAESQLRNLVTRTDTSFADLERAAVLEGTAPPEKDDKNIPSGRWSYQASGVFVQMKPFGYSRTRMNVYSPERFAICYDRQNRITTVLSPDGFSIETSYQNASGYSLKQLRVAKLNKIIFDTQVNESFTTDNRGFVDDLKKRLIGRKTRQLDAVVLSATNYRDAIKAVSASVSDESVKYFLDEYSTKVWMSTVYQWVNEDKVKPTIRTATLWRRPYQVASLRQPLPPALAPLLLDPPVFILAVGAGTIYVVATNPEVQKFFQGLGNDIYQAIIATNDIEQFLIYDATSTVGAPAQTGNQRLLQSCVTDRSYDDSISKMEGKPEGDITKNEEEQAKERAQTAEGKEIDKALDDVVDPATGAKPGDRTRGNVDDWQKPGGLKEANDDLQNIAKQSGGTTPVENRGGGLTTTLPDGTRINTYPERSSTGGAGLQAQRPQGSRTFNGRDERKITYK